MHDATLKFEYSQTHAYRIQCLKLYVCMRKHCGSIFDAQTKQPLRKFYLNILQFDFVFLYMHAYKVGNKCACALCVTKCHIDRMHINLNRITNRKRIDELISSLEFWLISRTLWTLLIRWALVRCTSQYLCILSMDRWNYLLLILFWWYCYVWVPYPIFYYIAYLNNHRRLHR